MSAASGAVGVKVTVRPSPDSADVPATDVPLRARLIDQPVASGADTVSDGLADTDTWPAPDCGVRPSTASDAAARSNSTSTK